MATSTSTPPLLSPVLLDAPPGVRRLSTAEAVLWVLFPGSLVWWFLGAHELIWVVASAALIVPVLTRTPKWPPAFGLWFSFLIWMVASGLSIDRTTGWVSFLYRSSTYFAATLTLLALYRAISSREITSERVLGLGTGFWCVVVAGGLLALAAPDLSFHSLTGRLIPSGLRSIRFISDMTTPHVSEVSNFLGYPVARPAAPFTYTNGWGSTFVLLVPFVMSKIASGQKRLRWGLAAALVISVVPFVFSLNRGAWISLAAGFGYVALRTFRRRPAVVLGLLLIVLLVGLVVGASPLDELVSDRIETGHSDEGRLALYRTAWTLTLEAPWFGHGTTVPLSQDSSIASAGTHGQLWLILVSHGFPGAVLFFGALGGMLWHTRRWTSVSQLWMHTVILMALLQAPYYELRAAQLFVVFAALAAYVGLERLGPRSTDEGLASVPQTA